uniref:uncharacterized protein LOC143395861 n=1 Tax=Callospermophilus lateralis TaxID=76772 RepID=UPI004038D780
MRTCPGREGAREQGRAGWTRPPRSAGSWWRGGWDLEAAARPAASLQADRGGQHEAGLLLQSSGHQACRPWDLLTWHPTAPPSLPTRPGSWAFRRARNPQLFSKRDLPEATSPASAGRLEGVAVRSRLLGLPWPSWTQAVGSVLLGCPLHPAAHPRGHQARPPSCSTPGPVSPPPPPALTCPAPAPAPPTGSLSLPPGSILRPRPRLSPLPSPGWGLHSWAIPWGVGWGPALDLPVLPAQPRPGRPLPLPPPTLGQGAAGREAPREPRSLSPRQPGPEREAPGPACTWGIGGSGCVPQDHSADPALGQGSSPRLGLQ